MLNSDEWKARVVDRAQKLCPACESTRVTMGACAIRKYDGASGIRVRRLPA